MSEINVTPFVDVMLVLLVIFMVAAPLMTVGVPIDLPKAKARALQQDNKQPIQISFQKDGSLYLNDDQVSPDRLIALIDVLSEGKKDKIIYIRGDQSLTYGQIMAVMGEINKAGYNRVALVSSPK